MSNIPIATHQTSPFVDKLYNIVTYIFIYLVFTENENQNLESSGGLVSFFSFP